MGFNKNIDKETPWKYVLTVAYQTGDLNAAIFQDI